MAGRLDPDAFVYHEMGGEHDAEFPNEPTWRWDSILARERLRQSLTPEAKAWLKILRPQIDGMVAGLSEESRECVKAILEHQFPSEEDLAANNYEFPPSRQQIVKKSDLLNRKHFEAQGSKKKQRSFRNNLNGKLKRIVHRVNNRTTGEKVKVRLFVVFDRSELDNDTPLWRYFFGLEPVDSEQIPPPDWDVEVNEPSKPAKATSTESSEDDSDPSPDQNRETTPPPPGPVAPMPPSADGPEAGARDRKPFRVRLHQLAAAVAILALIVALSLYMADGRSHTRNLQLVSFGTGIAVEGSDDRGVTIWSAPIHGVEKDVQFARWPPEPTLEAEFLAVATRSGIPAEPGELRVYDVRRPHSGEPPLVLQDCLEGPSFRTSPEAYLGAADPTAIGFRQVAFADVGEEFPHVVAIAHDRIMAPAWLFEYALPSGERIADLFHPGHLERLAVVDRVDEPRVVVSGVNNRVLCLSDSGLVPNCPPPTAPIVLVLDLPLASGQLYPGFGKDMPLVEPRAFWRLDPISFRFTAVERIHDIDGRVRVHVRDEGQDCWKDWILSPAGELETIFEPNPNHRRSCDVQPELIPVPN